MAMGVRHRGYHGYRSLRSAIHVPPRLPRLSCQSSSIPDSTRRRFLGQSTPTQLGQEHRQELLDGRVQGGHEGSIDLGFLVYDVVRADWNHRVHMVAPNEYVFYLALLKIVRDLTILLPVIAGFGFTTTQSSQLLNIPVCSIKRLMLSSLAHIFLR